MLPPMKRTDPASPRARATLDLVLHLQATFVTRLEAIASAIGDPRPFTRTDWARDAGRHGGGMRRGAPDATASTPSAFDRASINISAIHYDDEPDRPLASATALSAIVHPAHPHAPSMHLHLSYTELRSPRDASPARPGPGYWRMMADLNPAIPDPAATHRFRQCLRAAAPVHYEHAATEGDRYFFIPALNRHRGVAHFYLEAYDSGDFDADRALAEAIGAAAIATYADIVTAALASQGEPTDAERGHQLAYHTLYFFQVLTLDRGTTSGLLVHDQNDVGILGSLPSHIDRALLASWRDRLPKPQDALLDALVDALPAEMPDGHACPIDDDSKRALAAALRRHYRAHPQAIDLQAAGSITPPTVQNHGAPSAP